MNTPRPRKPKSPARQRAAKTRLRRWQVTKADAAACRREMSKGAWKDPGKRVRCMASHAQKRAR